MSKLSFRIVITVDIPEDVKTTDVREWAKFRTGYTASIKDDNPLANVDMEAKEFSIEYLPHSSHGQESGERK